MSRHDFIAGTLAVASSFLLSSGTLTATAASQAAQQMAVQSSCPTLLELQAGTSTHIFVPTPIDQVWPSIRTTLDAWSRSSGLAIGQKAPDPSKAVIRAGATLIVESAQPQFQGSSEPGLLGRTCFYEWRTGSVDSRLAFKFSARATTIKGRPSGSDVEVTWLSQSKGSAQRTWRNSTPDSTLLNGLLDLLRKGKAATLAGDVYEPVD